VPAEVRAHFAALIAQRAQARAEWNKRYTAWRAADAERTARWDAFASGEVPQQLVEALCATAPNTTAATRAHGGVVINQAAKLVPALIGGSADLDGSTKTRLDGSPSVTPKDFSGRNLHFGVREHGMTAVGNGLALGGYIPFTASFMTFTDYARPGIRLAALMKLRHVFVYTHDSIFLGEDGPTHQAIEQVASLRLIPNLRVFRPADGLETAAAWGLALERKDGPSLLALSRQNLPALTRPDGFTASDLRKGGYVLRESASKDAITLIATGSEVGVALDAATRLEAAGIPSRVVSMLSAEYFAAQDAAWRDRVLLPGGRRVSIEAGVTHGWYEWLGARGLAIGIDRFGESAPAEVLANFFGLTGEQVAKRVQEWAAKA
jgi:transketolase